MRLMVKKGSREGLIERWVYLYGRVVGPGVQYISMLVKYEVNHLMWVLPVLLRNKK